jgi:hypothetical protein
MTSHSRNLVLLAVIAAGLAPATAAQAQFYGAAYAQPAPLYRYAAQGRPYAVEVAPDTYEIHRPRAHHYARGRHTGHSISERASARFDRSHKKVDRALVEELRKRQHRNGNVINTTRIVRDPPLVVATKRYVDDPPRVIERRHVVEDAPLRSHRGRGITVDGDTGTLMGSDGSRRVIQADAEITILGPDRMNIRLFRKRHGSKVQADE